ncbi:ribosome small subunit-dependent GTPase A [Clostridium sp. SYSU_GA19001]|uniref:ribosome small subunit-dependent GTPase A n=1 Tax=Clostridium caldaquaticum TaxID=2940653 RepID=UPI002076E2D9|nr:ribosome small subunit-dependent GTPase A [Clostridium caldaquaticum]MCM8710575.1 ribosome small subunit-dependent GTPase A [Clostridium caldaquaticum]
MQGTIVKGIGGFYYVRTEKDTYECKARGKFRYDELIPMVGDRVEIIVKNNKGVIDKIYPRTSELIRPSVSNVTQAFVIFTFTNPDLNIDLLNKFLVLCEYNDIKAVVCFNKMDLVEASKYTEIIYMLQNAGYDVIFIKAKEGYGLEMLKEKLKQNITVFCGPSGVGKSTILNKLLMKDVMKTGEISEKLGRGKHTTRHSELVEFEDGFIVDTPGFTSLEMEFITKENLQFCFPEFQDYMNLCKFTGCLHYKEPQCAVKQAVEDKKINTIRYDFYVKTIEELMNRRNKR